MMLQLATYMLRTLGGFISMRGDKGICRMRRTIGFSFVSRSSCRTERSKEETCCNKGCCTIPDVRDVLLRTMSARLHISLSLSSGLHPHRLRP